MWMYCMYFFVFVVFVMVVGFDEVIFDFVKIWCWYVCYYGLVNFVCGMVMD